MSQYSLTIGGKAVTTAKTFNVLNPADESIVAACPEATIALVDEAVQSARRAFPAWAALPDAERAAKLNAVADLIEKHHQELSRAHHPRAGQDAEPDRAPISRRAAPSRGRGSPPA